MSHVLYHDHPRLGYVPSREAIEAVTPDQIRELWTQYFGRDNMYITVVGDFETDAMLALLQDKLRAWRPAKNSKRKVIRWHNGEYRSRQVKRKNYRQHRRCTARNKKSSARSKKRLRANDKLSKKHRKSHREYRLSGKNRF